MALPSRPPPKRKSVPKEPPKPKATKPKTPKKAPKAQKEPSKPKTTKKAPKAPKKATKKAAKKGKPSARPAVTNKVPRVRKIKSRYFGDDAILLGTLIRGMDAITIGHYERLELRKVPDRLQVIFNEELGIDPRVCYSRAEDTEKIIKFLKRVPKEFRPSKWERVFEA